MAENADSTSTPLPVSPRPLVIPYVLTPAELDGLLRIGESLANISDRLSAMMGRNGGPLAGEMRAFVEEVLVTLDRLDGDPDLEPDADGESTATERNGAGFIAAGGAPDDAEDDDPIEDDGDLEPSLGWTVGGNTASGNGRRDLDAEQDLSDEEPDDPLEWNHQPVRLDVALVGEEARHG